MTPLAGVMEGNPRRESIGWSLALSLALLAHVVVAAAMLWESYHDSQALPAAAPLVVELDLLAAPQAEASDLPPGPQQVEAAPAPEKVTREEPVPDVVPDPLPIHEPEVALESLPEPAQEQEEQREEDVEQEQETSHATPSDQSAPETTAPVAMDADISDVAAAPSVGAFSQQVADAHSRWEGRLLAHLERRKRYPRQAQMRQQEGVPSITFTMDRNGRVLEFSLAHSSQIAVLDEEALALIQRAQPLPPPPPEVPGETLKLTVPVEFFIGR